MSVPDFLVKIHPGVAQTCECRKTENPTLAASNSQIDFLMPRVGIGARFDANASLGRTTILSPTLPPVGTQNGIQILVFPKVMFSGFSICTSRHVLSPTGGRVGFKICHFLGCCFESVFSFSFVLLVFEPFKHRFQSRNIFWVQPHHFLNHTVSKISRGHHCMWFCCHAGISGLASRARFLLF